jgi:hypothetical protein
MADVVDTLVQFSGTRRHIVRLTNVSDATGESAVVKVDISTLTNGKGIAPTAVNIESIQWSIQGFTSVRLFWDHTTDDEIAVLGTGNGYRDFSQDGVLADPRSAGGTGDVLLTTAGATSGNTYDIVLSLILSD